MSEAWCRLTRQRDGAFLVLDGVRAFRVIDDVAATSLPIEQGADVTDHVQEQARMVLIDVEVSDTPLSSEVTTSGQDRLEEVLDFLASSIGELMTLTTTDRPTYRDLLLLSRGSPTHDHTAFTSALSLPMIESRIVSGRDALVGPPADQARVSERVEAGGDEVDRGDVPGRGKTLLVSALGL